MTSSHTPPESSQEIKFAAAGTYEGLMRESRVKDSLSDAQKRILQQRENEARGNVVQMSELARELAAFKFMIPRFRVYDSEVEQMLEQCRFYELYLMTAASRCGETDGLVDHINTFLEGEREKQKRRDDIQAIKDVVSGAASDTVVWFRLSEK